MDPPHAPPITSAPPLTTPQTTTTAAATTISQPYTDSIDSSPHSRATDFDDAPPTTTTTTITAASAASKLRLMCSYGGHIVPRPHTKSLCYVGGDTRMVVVDRSFTLSDLLNYLSKTLNFTGNHHNNSRRKPPFTLKYQLPNEDLDSLITVSTDEDLDNMIDEYDRLCSTVNAGKSGRIRLFLFPVRPEGAQSMGPILDGSNRSEDWFVSALNGTSELHRGFSDPNTVNCLLGLDHDVEIVNPNYLNLGSDGNSNSNNTSTGGGNNNLNNNNNNSNNNNINNNNNGMNNNHNNNGGNLKGEMVGEGLGGKKLRNSSAQDVQSVPDSPIVETTSSFGSGSSLPSLGSLPQIRVHADDGTSRFMEQRGGGGIEEQFAQMSVNGVGGGGGGSGGMQVQKVIDEGFMVMSSPHSVAVGGGGGGGDFGSRVYVDDLGFGKQQQQQQMGQGGGVMSFHAPQKQQQQLGGELPSPDSVASDGSLTGAIARQKPVMYHDANGQLSSGSNMFPPGMQVHQQVHESGYALLQQSDQVRQLMTQRHQNPQFVQQYHPQQQQTQTQPQAQPQYIPSGQHFVHHPPPGAVPMPAYYPVYPSQNHPHQYPIYYVPAGPAQGYSVPGQQQQPNIVEAAPTSVPPNRNQAPPNPTILSNSAYNPTRNMNLQPVNSDLGPAVYGTTTGAGGGPQLVQVPSSLHQTSPQSQSQSQPQQQHQYVGYSQVHHPQQSVAPNTGAGSGYAYEFADPAHPKVYFTQPLAPAPATAPAPVPASQYQGMTSAGPTMIISDGSSQLSNDSLKQQT